MRPFAAAGALFGFLGVALGAFGAHALRDQIPADRLAVFQTGVQYQAMHALALLILGLAARESRAMRVAGWLFVAGVVVFSGSLYALALTGTRGFGAVTPFGGVALLAGWVAVLWSTGKA